MSGNIDACQRSSFHFQVNFGVYIRRVQRDMSQPSPDRIDVDTAARHMDSCRVANVVRAYPFGLHRWNLTACHFSIVRDETVDTESRHLLVRSAEKDELIGTPPNNQLIEQGHDHWPKWTHPDLVAFPMDPH